MFIIYLFYACSDVIEARREALEEELQALATPDEEKDTRTQQQVRVHVYFMNIKCNNKISLYLTKLTQLSQDRAKMYQQRGNVFFPRINLFVWYRYLNRFQTRYLH